MRGLDSDTQTQHGMFDHGLQLQMLPSKPLAGGTATEPPPELLTHAAAAIMMATGNQGSIPERQWQKHWLPGGP